MITGRSAHRCEVCGAGEDRQTRRWLEAHERWAYDDATRVQSLRRLVCLCTDCHTAGPGWRYPFTDPVGLSHGPCLRYGCLSLFPSPLQAR